MLLLSCINIHAQNKLEGKIIDTKAEGVAFCPLALLNAVDSTVAKGTLTNENGVFTFENMKQGSYLLKVSYVGYIDTILSVGYLDSLLQKKTEPLVLRSAQVNLNEVSVTAMKKPMEFKNGNVTVNIEGSPMAIGNSVYDLLMRLPGVVVTDGVISIQGKSGVKVMIDDRVQQLSGPQLMGILQGMSASNILKIEILKNPPVKYDAAGNAGIINIVTKKVKITGFSGSANFSNRQGFYDTQQGGITLNYKAKKLTFFSGISIDDNNQHNVNNKLRAITDNGVTTTLTEHSTIKEGGPAANIFAGLDWFVNDKNTLGVRVEDIPGSTHNIRIGHDNISDNSLGYNGLDFKSSVPNTWNYIYTNFNAEHLFDTIGTKLKFNGDFYGPYNDQYPGSFQNNFYTNGIPSLPSSDFNNSNTIHVNTLLTRLDFEKKISKTFNLEAGAKGSFDNMNSMYTLKNLNPNTGTYVTDTNYTNNFTYKDQILAAYVNLQKQLKNFSLQGGVRAENTHLQTLSITSGIAYKRNYFNMFPTASLGYNLKDKHNFQLSFNRRIDRPDYNNYNPYRQFFGNLLGYSIGNPSLYPAYTDNFEISHNYKGMVGGSFSYSRTSNYMFGYTTQNDSTKQAVAKIGNLKTYETYALSMFFQKDLIKWWTLSINITGYYFNFSGTVNNTYYANSGPSGYGNISNNINLPKNFKLEVSGVYLTPWLSGVNSTKSRWAANFSIKKSFLNDRLNFSAGVNDLFFTLGTRNSVYIPGQTYKVNVTFDTRRIVTAVTYNFGKVKIAQRDIKDNEDKKRIGH